jgi:signal transduction histidine kinase
MIDTLSEVARRADAPQDRLDLGELIAESVERARPAFSARGLPLVGPEERLRAWIIGSAAVVERALDEVLSVAAAHSGKGECRVSFGRAGADARCAVRVPLAPSPPTPSLLFKLDRPSDGDPFGSGLVLARWTFESLGGKLEAAMKGPSLVLTAEVPAGDA